MFVSISRGSSKANPPNLCASCLSSILGQPDSLSLTLRQPLLHRASRSARRPFSTNNAYSDHYGGDDSAEASEGKAQVSSASSEPGLTKLSQHKQTIKDLRDSLRAHEELGSGLMEKKPKRDHQTKPANPKSKNSPKLENTEEPMKPSIDDGRTKSRKSKSKKSPKLENTDDPVKSSINDGETNSLKSETKNSPKLENTDEPVKRSIDDGQTKNLKSKSESKSKTKSPKLGSTDTSASTIKLSTAKTATKKHPTIWKVASDRTKTSKNPLRPKKTAIANADESTKASEPSTGKSVSEKDVVEKAASKYPNKTGMKREQPLRVVRKLLYPSFANVNVPLIDTITQLAQHVGKDFARKVLVNAANDPALKPDERIKVKQTLRRFLVKTGNRQLEEPAKPVEDLVVHLKAFETIGDAMQSRPLPLVRNVQSKASVQSKANVQSANVQSKAKATKWIKPLMAKSEIETIEAEKLELVAVESKQPPVPGLSYGLERVLFNPGVYHLQDPRSRVFNFDPYLQKIMPASEFDFNALKEYITSSRDKALLASAAEEQKKYTGSTSSMTAALSHFHFLLSQWRPVQISHLSKKFRAPFDTFTAISRAPSAIFLRHRDGVYAIDADKQFDNANILMMLGKSMEKLLTLPTEEFEKYRRVNSEQISEEQRNEPEAFHYTTMGDFLMRSQLDAYDERLPGTGMFDLKTRAVCAIRMDIDEYEDGMGYEIHSRHGEFESFEREYYDMIRSAFLKYSLQVRMGRMDGIFVAFHNADRIFGFQYISISEMDYALHGTEDTTIGDSEFKISVDLLNRVLDRATAKFPGKSLRLHFETRDKVNVPFTYIFAEPFEEEEIDRIQATNKHKIEAFEKEVLGLGKSEAELKEEKRRAEWMQMQAQVEESVEDDELGISDALQAKAGDMFPATDLDGNAPDDGEDEDEDEDEEEEDDDEDKVVVEGEEEHIDEVENGLMENSEKQLDKNDVEQDDNENENEDEEEVEDEDVEDEDESTKELDSEGNAIEEKESDADQGLEVRKESDFVESANEDKYKQEGSEAAGSADSESQLSGNTEILEEGETSAEEIPDEDRFAAESSVETAGADSDNETGDQLDVMETDDNAMESSEDSSNIPTEDDENEQQIAGFASATNHADGTSNETPGTETKRPLLGMTLMIRNKINGKYKERPDNLTAEDKWTVEYAFTELSEESARKAYRSLKKRRANVLDRAKSDPNKEKSDFQSDFLATLKEYSKKGREWRQKQDLLDAQNPPKVLFVKELENAEVNGTEEKPKD